MNNITTQKAVQACLSYFDIFQHPLKKEEIANFLSISCEARELDTAISDLKDANLIFNINDYYSLHNNINLVIDRIAFEKRADEKMKEALHYGQLIQKFPFTKAVCISGSLSKHIMKKDSDIDFFIMAKANRIWIAKLLLKMYKFLFLNNSKDVFCINYFIAENNLSIAEQNTFTATELVTLIPIGCQVEYEKILKQNKWYKEFLPNYTNVSKESFPITAKEKPYVSKLLEMLFSGKWGNFIDTRIMKLHAMRNRKKYAKLKNNKDFELMLRATKNQIKVHPPNSQNVTLAKYKSLINNLDNSY